VSYGSFLRVWRADCPAIKLRKFLRFSKCQACTTLKAEKAQHRGKGNVVPPELSKHNLWNTTKSSSVTAPGPYGRRSWPWNIPTITFQSHRMGRINWVQRPKRG